MHEASIFSQTLKIDGADHNWPADCFVVKAEHKQCLEFLQRMKELGVDWPVVFHPKADDGAVPAIRWSGIYYKPDSEGREFVEEYIVKEAAANQTSASV